MLREVRAIRYATPLREGGSLPGIMEADDLGTWVVKFRGAGQGVRSLVAEVIVGELGRALGLPVPELVVIDVDPVLGRVEPDQEIQDLLRASAGANLGIDYLPGSITYDPLAFTVDPQLAARVVWLDALTLNVDRSWRNPNLLVWGGRLWLIDHGAALYPHHGWSARAAERDPAPGPPPAPDLRVLPRWEEHVLLPALGDDPAGALRAADAALAPLVRPGLLAPVVAAVAAGWLDVDAARYVDWLTARCAGDRPWLEAMTAADPATVAAARVEADAARSAPPAWLRPALSRAREAGRG
ncbi:HipA family kinase [Pseudofrankia sp. DC12]|uniref:HipA family kinase n=1 Tax=Pseudofrankia sp. DC12 TaxID=683315 RepID=UPI0005F7E9F4|nr:HipA family kinase [Pseudofrankia sp. DC12]